MRVKELLRERKMTAKELAEKLGMTANGFSIMMGRDGNPPLSKLRQIASILDVPVWQLFIDEEDVAMCAENLKSTPIKVIVGGKTYVARSVDEDEEKQGSMFLGDRLKKGGDALFDALSFMSVYHAEVWDDYDMRTKIDDAVANILGGRVPLSDGRMVGYELLTD